MLSNSEPIIAVDDRSKGTGVSLVSERARTQPGVKVP